MSIIVDDSPLFITAENNVYDGRDLRRPFGDIVGTGVKDRASFVVNATTPLSMNVRIGTAGAESIAWVPCGEPGGGSYRVRMYGQVTLPTLFNVSGSPRIDSVVLEVRDPQRAGIYSDAAITVLQGTPTAGATLDNRSGAPALPDNSIHLADIRAFPGATSVTSTNIRDHRPFGHRGHLPTLHSDVDYMIPEFSPGCPMGKQLLTFAAADTTWWALVWCPREMPMNGIRWAYWNVGSLSGNWRFAGFSSSGRRLWQSSSTAFDSVAGLRHASATISGVPWQAGWNYLAFLTGNMSGGGQKFFYGNGPENGREHSYIGQAMGQFNINSPGPNISGGGAVTTPLTFPDTLRGFGSDTGLVINSGSIVPQVELY